jgi:hypothetical protein
MLDGVMVMMLPVLATMNSITEGAFARLIKAVGRDRALRVGGAGLEALGLRELRTPNELLSFANYLIRQGGIFESVGSGLKVSALLRGAIDPSRMI